MVSIAEARQQLARQRGEVSEQIRGIEATQLPQPTRSELGRAAQQSQARYKTALPGMKSALASAKETAIEKLKAFSTTELGKYEAEIGAAEQEQARLNQQAYERQQSSRKAAQKKAEKKAEKERVARTGLTQENIKDLLKYVDEKQGGYIEVQKKIF